MKKFAKILGVTCLALLVLYLYNSYQDSYHKNYYKTFYQNIPRGDVISNECTKEWKSYQAEFYSTNHPEKVLHTIDYLYDYQKKRCLLDEWYDNISVDSDNYKVYSRISDLITKKELWYWENTVKKSVFTFYAKDYASDKEWESNPPYISFNDLQNLSQ